MSDRENLIELLDDSMFDWDDLISEYQENGEVPPDTFVEHIADHLIANGVTVQKWIPVSERLPEDGALSIVTYIRCDNGEPASDGIAYRDRGCWYWRFDSPENDEVVFAEITHWMQLPQPPKGE